MAVLTGVIIWVATILSLKRVRLNDVRRVICWLSSERPKVHEVIVGWWWANFMVWLLAIQLHEKCGSEVTDFAGALYRVVELF